LRALAVTTATRSESLPDIPAVAEFLPGYDASAFFGLGAPKGTPAEIIEKLNRDINVALADPVMKARLADQGGTPLPGSPADAPAWWAAPLAISMIGLGFYMLHNTLQTNATQMAPRARATGVCMFSAALYLGQPAGVAAMAPVIDRYGATPVFGFAAIALPTLGLWFARRLVARRAE
jgi:hypothetical protein